MAYSTYLMIRLILMGVLLFLGVHMIFEKLPTQLRSSFYHRALKIMGVAFLFIPLSCFLYSDANRLDLEIYLSTAINLTTYYATFVSMSLSFFILLGRKLSRAIIGVGIALSVVYPLPMWFSIAFCDKEVVDIVISASYSYFVIMTLSLSVVILLRHHRVIKNIDNFYSDDVMICVKWISKSIWMFMGLVAVCIFAPVFFCLSSLASLYIYDIWRFVLFPYFLWIPSYVDELDGVFCYECPKCCSI